MSSPRHSAKLPSITRLPHRNDGEEEELFYNNKSVFVKMQLLKPKDAFVSHTYTTLITNQLLMNCMVWSIPSKVKCIV